MPPKAFTKVTSTNTSNPEFLSLDKLVNTSQSTPARRKQQGFLEHHSGHEFMRAIPLYLNLAKESRGMLVRPVPKDIFLATQLPCNEARTCPNIKMTLTNKDFELKSRVKGHTPEAKFVSCP